jgi:primosomal protein N' (replication factor Y)
VAATVGARRTAEELGRAFPGVPVLTSGGRAVRREVPAEPALVVATPGAEPLTPHGYSAALLLDAWALLGRADLRADEETLRRWMTASALVRAAGVGGRVVVVADAALRPVQALLRWDPVRFADHDMTERQALGLPPQRRFAVVSGPAEAVAELVQAVELPEEATTFGPMAGVSRSGEPNARWVVTTSVGRGPELAMRLRQAMGTLSVRKHRVPRVQVDPAHLSL